MVLDEAAAGQAERCASAWLTMLFALGCRVSVVSPRVERMGDEVAWVVNVRLPGGDTVERTRAGALHHAVRVAVGLHLTDGDEFGDRMREYADMMSIELPDVEAKPSEIQVPVRTPHLRITDYQWKILQDYSRLVLIDQTRLVGVTTALVGRAVKDATNGRDTQYLTHWDQRTGLDTFRDYVKLWCARVGQSTYREESFGDYAVLRFDGGGKIAFVPGLRPEHLRGIPGSPSYIIDGLADAESPRDLLAAARALLIRPGGTLTVASTLSQKDDAWSKLLSEGIGSVHSIDFDDAYRAGLPWFTEKGASLEEARASVKGTYDHGEPNVVVEIADGPGYSPWLEPVDLEYTYTGADLSAVKP